MSRYVDAEELEATFRRIMDADVRYNDRAAFNEMSNALNVLESFCKDHIRDVQEVKHGHWVKAERRGCTTYHNSYAECSNCHGEPLQFCRDFKYCPHCGAKMDEEEE